MTMKARSLRSTQKNAEEITEPEPNGESLYENPQKRTATSVSFVCLCVRMSE